MSLEGHVGSFDIPSSATVGTTIAITGVGFTPKFLRVWVSGRSESTPTVSRLNNKRALGVGASASSRAMIAHQSQNDVGTSNTDRGYREDAILGIISTGAAWDGLLDLQSFDSDGFTVIVDQQFGQSLRVHYEVLGGTSLTDVFIGRFQNQNSLGDQAVTGVGFQPDFVGFMSAAVEVSPPSIVAPLAGCTTGGMVSATEQGYVNNSAQNGVGTANTDSSCHQGTEAHARLANGLTNNRFAFSSMDSDGFTVEITEIGIDQFIFWCLKGGEYTIVEFDSSTSGADIVVPVGFTPVLVEVVSALFVEDAINSAHAGDLWSMGAFSSPANRAVHTTTEANGVGFTIITSAVREDAIYQRLTGAPSVAATMDVKAIGDLDFTCVMDLVEPSGAAHLTAYVFGNPAVGEVQFDASVEVKIPSPPMGGGGSDFVTRTSARGNRVLSRIRRRP